VSARARRDARLVLATALVLAATFTASAVAVPTNATQSAVKPQQKLAVVLKTHTAFERPSEHSKAVDLVRARRPITGERTVLPILGRRTTVDRRGGPRLRWLRVRLPGRPNEKTGWIRQRATTFSRTPWHIVVSLSRRRTVVYKSGHRVRAFSSIVGKPATPTPRGQFFVEEDVQLRSGDVGAPYALALSARSDVLQEFDGGPGQIAVHGLENVGGELGTAVSHGCVRLSDRAMRWLVFRISPGVPVTITR
jgi:lipoprotein-anchoring transpeptidase ErfK/SrfK